MTHLESTGPAGVRIVVLGLPAVAGPSRMDQVLHKRIAAINHWTRGAVEHHERARYVPAPTLARAGAAFTRVYYAAIARAVVEDGLHDLLS